MKCDVSILLKVNILPWVSFFVLSAQNGAVHKSVPFLIIESLLKHFTLSIAILNQFMSSIKNESVDSGVTDKTNPFSAFPVIFTF